MTPAPGAWPSYRSWATSKANLEPRSAGVEQRRDSFARGELALLMHSGDSRRAATLTQLGREGAEFRRELPEPSRPGATALSAQGALPPRW
jgi:hypothetical protein